MDANYECTRPLGNTILNKLPMQLGTSTTYDLRTVKNIVQLQIQEGFNESITRTVPQHCHVFVIRMYTHSILLNIGLLYNYLKPLNTGNLNFAVSVNNI